MSRIALAHAFPNISHILVVAGVVCTSLFTPLPIKADFEIVPGLAAEHAGAYVIEDVSFDGSETSVVVGDDLYAATAEWHVQVLVPFDDAIPVERTAFVLGKVNGDTFTVAEPYAIAHAAIPDTGAVTVSFPDLILKDPVHPSGLYTLQVYVYPETKFVENTDPICSDWDYWDSVDWEGYDETCFPEEPYTEQDFLDWFEWNVLIDPDTYEGDIPETYGPDDTRQLVFEYVASTGPVYQECCSSVLFIPGIQGTRLYENGNRRWEPDEGETDIEALYLDGQGKSVSSDIEIGEVIGTFDALLDVNIYKSLLDDLETAQTVGTIAGYDTVPYDWRLSIPDILADGSIEQKLRDIATDSQTEKVTIVTHSNGALVAKALINALGPDAADLVDQVIFVAGPQLGTPQAVGAFLHGFDAGTPSVISAEQARDFAKNAPMLYQLLPHADYQNNDGFTLLDPLITFLPGASTTPFINQYGSFIETGSELYDFINGTEGRNEPHYLDLESPAIGNTSLLSSVETLQQSIGSSWTPPNGIIVHQIAGTGEDTLAGVTYSSGESCIRAIQTHLPVGPKLLCLEYGEKLLYTPNEVADGDGTVVVPSALAISDADENVDRWWIDLETYHDNHSLEFKPLRKDHKNLFEIPELRAFILNNLIAETATTLPEYLSAEAPVLEAENRLRFILHSPLALSATDDTGNEISETVATVPGATYKRYGEVQVIWIPKDAFPTLHLVGEEDGSFTLEVEEYTGEELVTSTRFSGIPSSANSLASMNFPDGTVQNASDLTLDYDGDGVNDLALALETDGEVTLPEPSLTDLLSIIKEVIHTRDISNKLKKKLTKRVEKLEKKIEKKKQKNQKILEKLEKNINKKATKGKIDTGDAELILQLLEELEAHAEDISLDDVLLDDLKMAIQGLDIKNKQKNQLVKRVERLENLQNIIRTLSRLETKIIKKGDKGKISDEDVHELLELLERVEEVI